MNKLIYISAIIILANLSIGCSDFLDSKPLDFTATSNFYQNQNDIETALIGCYGSLINSYSVNGRTGIFLIGNVGTDEILGNPYSAPDAESNMEQFIFGRVTKNNKNIRDLWRQMYASLYNINQLLYSIENVQMEEGRKSQIIGETRFLRGWHYMYIGMIFGGAPIYTTVPHEVDKGRNSLNEVMNQAIEDLSFAYDNLPSDALANPGKASKWSAGGYLARLYSYLASAKKFNAGVDLNFGLNSFEWVDVDMFYDKASIIVEDIIDNSGLTLTDDYRFLFCEGSKSKQQEEILFTYLPSPQLKIGFGLMYYLLPVGTRGGGWGTCRPSQEVYSRYDISLDIRGKWNVGGLSHLDSEIEVLDGNNYFRPSPLNLSNGEAYDGDYCSNKFRVMNTVNRHEDYYSGYYPLLRMGEIVLLKAEIDAHKFGDEAGRNVLKYLRSRAISDESKIDQLQSTYRKSDFIQELLDERSRELCFEQVRKFDLIRFDRYETTIKSISTSYGVWNRNSALQLVENITDTKIWSPIPEEDELANPNLKPNNPGYE